MTVQSPASTAGLRTESADLSGMPKPLHHLLRAVLQRVVVYSIVDPAEIRFSSHVDTCESVELSLVFISLLQIVGKICRHF